MIMKNLIFIGLLLLVFINCTSSKNIDSNSKKVDVTSKFSDTVRIANKELEYEVIIFEPGFNAWLATQAQPRQFYSENYLESRNRIFVSEWNRRATQPQQYNSNLYEMPINYSASIHYGYEVNYLIYNYFIFFQLTYKQQLSSFVPRN